MKLLKSAVDLIRHLEVQMSDKLFHTTIITMQPHTLSGRAYPEGNSQTLFETVSLHLQCAAAPSSWDMHSTGRSTMHCSPTGYSCCRQ